MAVATLSEKELIEASEKALHEARSIHERATAEKRDMSAEEREQFDKLTDVVADHGKQLSELASDRDDDPEDKDENPEKEGERSDEEKEKDAKERSNRIERLNSQLRNRSTGRISRTTLGGDNEYRSSSKYMAAYRSFLRNGPHGMLPHEHRDLSLGTNSAGGYLVTPTKLADDIVTAVNNLVFVRQMAKITKVVDAKSLGNPQLTTDIQGITWGDEVTIATADTSMVFGRRDLTPIMATNLIKVSHRELQASPRVEEVIAERIALSFAYGEETQYLTGDGSGHPLGVFTASASGISTGRDVTATGSAHSFVADDLFNMVYSIPQQYQNSKNFVWTMHRDAVKMAVKIKDGNGQYVWSQGGYTYGLVGNRAPSLLGFPVCQSEYAPNTFGTGNYIAVLGDWSYYRIAETMDMEIQRLVELYAGASQIGFLARKYVDGSPVLEKAFARLKLA